MALKEQIVLGLYQRRVVSLQRAAELLSVDLWTMIEKLKKADIHLDYTSEELCEDFSKNRL
jgi:predicted HTH domain antitoxin